MPKQKAVAPLVPPEPKDKLAKFRVTADTLSVMYAGAVWRVRKQTPKLLAISRGSGEREEFLWIYREVAQEVPPPKPKKQRKPKAETAKKVTKRRPKARPKAKESTKKVATPKKVAKAPTKKRGSVRKKKK